MVVGLALVGFPPAQWAVAAAALGYGYHFSLKSRLLATLGRRGFTPLNDQPAWWPAGLSPRGCRIEGTMGDARVVLDSRFHGVRQRRRWRIEVERAGLPAAFGLTHHGEETRRLTDGINRDSTGLPVVGDEVEFLIHATPQGRAAMYRLVDGLSGGLVDGKIVVERAGHPAVSEMGEMFDAAGEVSFAMRRPLGRTPDILADRASSDPDLDIRRRALGTLVDRYSEDAAAARAAKAALECGDPGLAVLAARVVGVDAVEPLVGYAMDESVSLVERLACFRTALEQAPAVLLRRVGSPGFAHKRPEFVERAFQLLSEWASHASDVQLGWLREAVQPLRPSFALFREFATAWIRLLVVSRIDGVQSELLEYLDSPSTEVRLAAIDGLAQRGGPYTLERLEALASKLLVNRQVKAAARSAADAIRARGGHESIGRVSVAGDGLDGAVSLTDERATEDARPR